MKPPFRIAVLECDVSPPTSTHTSYTGWFADLLKAGAATLDDPKLQPSQDLEIKGWNIYQDPDHYPEDDEIDAILLTGSKLNAFDNHDWILKLVEYTKRILAHDRIKIIGVCFGHQILGRAMGVKVGRGTLGWEISVTPITLSEKGKQLFKKDNLNLHQMHRDIVYDHPEGVEALGSTSVCKTQGMYLQGKFISVQAHPEFNSKTMKWLLEVRHEQGLFDDELYENALRRMNNEHDGIAVSQAFLRFLLEG